MKETGVALQLFLLVAIFGMVFHPSLAHLAQNPNGQKHHIEDDGENAPKAEAFGSSAEGFQNFR